MDIYAQVARELCTQRAGLALTGAGISVDSGIPDFRSAGGIWERYPPEKYATLDAFRRHPEQVWRFLNQLRLDLERAQPNAGHQALARLEQLAVVDHVATQNIDGLHQKAGSRKVIELHGNGRTLSCLECKETYTREQASTRGMPPLCACGYPLKPDVVLFGELLPPAAFAAAQHAAQRARVLLLIGTSAVVHPAASLPRTAMGAGARLVEINVATTELSPLCDYRLVGRASEVLPRLADAVAKLLRAR
jgi:NAD-dependent deacetylase